MNRIPPIPSAIVGLLIIGISILISLTHQRKALFSVAGVSKIEKEHGVELRKIKQIDSGGVGYSGINLDFGRFVHSVYGKYSAEDAIKLSKSEDPVVTMVGLELLSWMGYDDYLVRYVNDSRIITYRSGCTINVTESIGEVLTRYYGIDNFSKKYDIQMQLLGVVLIRWG